MWPGLKTRSTADFLHTACKLALIPVLKHTLESALTLIFYFTQNSNKILLKCGYVSIHFLSHCRNYFKRKTCTEEKNQMPISQDNINRDVLFGQYFSLTTIFQFKVYLGDYKSILKTTQVKVLITILN